MSIVTRPTATERGVQVRRRAGRERRCERAFALPARIGADRARRAHACSTSPGAKIGGGSFAMIAGPCTVESREQTLETARAVRDAGGTLLRGGAYKPRTSPYAFQGLGREGLRLLAEAKPRPGCRSSPR